MEVLTGDTLAEALLFCSQQENVSVCVVLDNMRNTKELVEILWREIELGNLPGWVIHSKHEEIIRYVFHYRI